jgi:hypothetical protein
LKQVLADKTNQSMTGNFVCLKDMDYTQLEDFGTKNKCGLHYVAYTDDASNFLGRDFRSNVLIELIVQTKFSTQDEFEQTMGRVKRWGDPGTRTIIKSLKPQDIVNRVQEGKKQTSIINFLKKNTDGKKEEQTVK